MADYKIGKYTKSKLNLVQLNLDTDNFRIGKQSSQPDAIHAMLTRSGTKVAGLADSIAINGFHDLELPCVFPDGASGHYTVAEGNRRITVLKALHTPDLANNTALHSKFKQLNTALKETLPDKIECAIFQNRKECLAYVLMRHGYGADGSGLMRWDAISKLRADAFVNDTIHPELNVIDFVLNEGTLGQASQQRLNDDDFNITNLQRIVDDASVRKLLGVEASDVTTTTHGKPWLVAVWQKVVEIIISGSHRGDKFTVDKNLNTTLLRNTFMSEVIEDVHGTKPSTQAQSQPTSTSGATTTSSNGSATTSPAGTNPSKGTQTTKHETTKQRKGLIAKSFSPQKLEPQKVINIVDELKKLSVTDFSNCSGVMFRVFLELSIIHYMKAKKIPDKKKHPTKSGLFIELKLREKITAVAKYLEANSILSHNETKPLRDLKDPSHSISAESLNAYVHSSGVAPDPHGLKLHWDNLQSIFTVLWKK